MKTTITIEHERNESQIELAQNDNGDWEVTVTDDEGYEATMILDRRALVRLTNYLNEELTQ